MVDKTKAETYEKLLRYIADVGCYDATDLTADGFRCQTKSKELRDPMCEPCMARDALEGRGVPNYVQWWFDAQQRQNGS